MSTQIPKRVGEALSDLRQVVASIEGCDPQLAAGESAERVFTHESAERVFTQKPKPLTFGILPLDRALQGGLAPAALHEVTPAAMNDLGSAAGFTLALAARAQRPGKSVIWIQTDFASFEAGNIYGLGCDLAGLAARNLLIVKAPRPSDALWAMEEALKCRALSCVVAELPNDATVADLTATRRLTLAAREGGAFGFLLRHRTSPLTSSAETRWQVSAARGEGDAFGGLGRAAFALSLHKNRRGPTGHWTIAWDHHERVFSALSLGVAAAALDRQDRAPLASAG